MRIAVVRRGAALFTITAIALGTLLVSPAWACGCGAYSPAEGGSATVPRETALVVAPGNGTEDVYLSLSVDSDVKSGALLFPVPDKQAKVKAGPTGLFEDLSELTAPPTPTHAQGSGDGNGGAQAKPSVTVESRQQIGPLDVVTLSSGDAAALTGWLSTNGFAAKPALTAAAEPYIRDGWAFVAVRLRPGASESKLDGTLDPLRISFATDETVYPMRLSAMASEPEEVTVYLLSDHRAELQTSTVGMSASWAGNLSDLSGHHSLAEAAGSQRYLTRFDGTLEPAQITGDFRFTNDRSDEPVGTQSADRPTGAIPHSASASPSHAGRNLLLAVTGVLAVALVTGGLVLWQRRRT